MWLIKRPRIEMDFPRLADRLFNEFFSTPWLDLTMDSTVWAPKIDIKESKDSYEILADLPGLDRKDIQVSLHDNVLTLKGERRYEEKQEDQDRCYYERSYGQFFRSVRLPDRVDEKKVQAEYKDGVLRIKLAKSEEAKAREIEIK
ncbi:MAG: Hsp20/alpha crystallin family protein [candidate division KSB1 bacterium]|nr:Hsp20/alpha crystallin family protein [candidate division KSB1 bacterium]MDZ7371628.1 Hsp20/alpha crystallin family protein [candidate division KSB1 bacterium]